MAETIKFVVDAASTKNLGLKTQDNSEFGGKWFNYGGINQEEMKSIIGSVRKGDYVEVLVVDNKFTEIISHEAGTNGSTTTAPQAATGFMDDYVTYEELLEKLKFETNGSYSIECKALEINTEKQYAIFQAHVRGEFGTIPRVKTVNGEIITTNEPNARWATCHGDANQTNCAQQVRQHYIRMAETRAQARALRAVLGIGKTAAEEILR